MSESKKSEEYKQEWINGLPPVDEECEINIYGDEWRASRCVGHGNIDGANYAVVIDRKGYCVVSSKGVRPLKYKEDTEREDTVRKIVSIIRYSESEPLSHKKTAHALYDAGFRKVKELSDEEIEEIASQFDTLKQRLWFRSGATIARNIILGKDNG